jgi:quinol monooxygenase YgiN
MMFVVLYRWRLKRGREEAFREGWRRRTEEIYRRRGSLGSRLHESEDGTWMAYAQWPDRAAWEAAQKVAALDGEAGRLMAESVEESLPPVFMRVADDLLRRSPHPVAE